MSALYAVGGPVADEAHALLSEALLEPGTALWGPEVPQTMGTADAKEVGEKDHSGAVSVVRQPKEAQESTAGTRLYDGSLVKVLLKLAPTQERSAEA